MQLPPCRDATDRSAKIGSVPDFMASLIKVGVTTVLTNKKSREEEINVSSHIGKGGATHGENKSSEDERNSNSPRDSPIAYHSDSNRCYNQNERVKAQIFQPWY